MTGLKNKRQKKRNRRGRMIVTFMSALLVAVFAVRIADLQQKNNSIEKQIALLEDDYKEQEDRKKELEKKEKYMHTKKFAEEYAKEKLGLIYPDEVVFKADQ